MPDHQLSITKFVPEHHSPNGHVFIEILANVRIVEKPKIKVEFSFAYPYTVRVSRREGHAFNHGCHSIEAAQAFLAQHKHDIELIAPAGKVRAYYDDGHGRYYYMGRSYKDEPHWRAEESRAAWLSPSEFDAVVAEAAVGHYNRDKTILQHVHV